MATQLQIRQALRSKLTSITGIGNVYDWLRYTKDKDQYLDIFGVPDDANPGSKKIHTWMFSRVSNDAAHLSGRGGKIENIHIYHLHGYLGLDDAVGSELVFQDLIEDIEDEFGSDPALYNDDNTVLVKYVPPPDLLVVDHIFLGPVLCHHAQLALSVTDHKARTD